MSDSKLFTVTLADLGEYTVSVAAANETEARDIAKGILFEEATQLAEGLTIIKRECQANAVLAEKQPAGQFRVRATYSLDFSMEVPAWTRPEAEAHARRLYEENCGPFEFDHDGDRVGPFTAREVVS